MRTINHTETYYVNCYIAWKLGHETIEQLAERGEYKSAKNLESSFRNYEEKYPISQHELAWYHLKHKMLADEAAKNEILERYAGCEKIDAIMGSYGCGRKSKSLVTFLQEHWPDEIAVAKKQRKAAINKQQKQRYQDSVNGARVNIHWAFTSAWV